MPSAVYATVQQVRDFGIAATDASDAVVSDALATASRWVDNQTDQRLFGFGAPVVGATVTLRDVSGPVATLPAPLSAVTAVLVNVTVQTDLTAWVVEGVDNRLLRFAPNGFSTQIGGRLGARVGGYAASLTVTGTWGYPTVTAAASKASWLYAAHQLVTEPTFQQTTSERIGNYSSTAAGMTLEDLALQALADGGYLTAVLA